jgi:hypothetical protein
MTHALHVLVENCSQFTTVDVEKNAFEVIERRSSWMMP